MQSLEQEHSSGKPLDPKVVQNYMSLAVEQAALRRVEHEQAAQVYQRDWAARVQGNGKATGVFTDYHYYGTGDIGGAPDEESVKRLEAIVTRGEVDMPPASGMYFSMDEHPKFPGS